MLPQAHTDFLGQSKALRIGNGGQLLLLQLLNGVLVITKIQLCAHKDDGSARAVVPHLGEPLAREQNGKDVRRSHTYGHAQGKERGTPEKSVSKVANTLSFLAALPSSVGHYSLAQASPCCWVLMQNPWHGAQILLSKSTSCTSPFMAAWNPRRNLKVVGRKY